MSFGNEREFIDHLQNKEGKEQAMKCPLFFMGWLAGQGKSELIDIYCLKEECACWDKKLGMCIGVTIALELRLISESLTLLLAKMPHAGQSTK